MGNGEMGFDECSCKWCGKTTQPVVCETDIGSFLCAVELCDECEAEATKID